MILVDMDENFLSTAVFWFTSLLSQARFPIIRFDRVKREAHRYGC